MRSMVEGALRPHWSLSPSTTRCRACSGFPLSPGQLKIMPGGGQDLAQTPLSVPGRIVKDKNDSR